MSTAIHRRASLRGSIVSLRVAIRTAPDPTASQIVVDEDLNTLTLPAAPPIRPNAKSLAFDRVFPVGYPQVRASPV
jgi:hypothetical protein